MEISFKWFSQLSSRPRAFQQLQVTNPQDSLRNIPFIVCVIRVATELEKLIMRFVSVSCRCPRVNGTTRPDGECVGTSHNT